MFLEQKNTKGLILCVDFGTTNSVVSFYEDSKEDTTFILFDGLSVFPTAILFNKKNDNLEITCGTLAKNASMVYPESTILSVKSMLGTDDELTINVDGDDYRFTPEQIVGLILEEIRIKSNEYIKNELKIENEFTGIVVTVPANSTDKQKNKTKNAAILAGFNEEDIYIRLEPAAAAIGYANRATNDSKVLIYDFGGGTFDACLLDVQMDNRKPVVSIKNTSGDNNLGGNNVDKIILDIIYDRFLSITDNKIDLFDDDYTVIKKSDKKVALARLVSVASSVKEKLSKSQRAKVNIAPLIQEPFIVNINLEITADDFKNHKRKHSLGDSPEIFEKYKDKNLFDIIDMTINEIDNCLSDCEVSKNEVNEVFLVGGSSQLPLVFEKVTEYFGKEPFKGRLNPALAISEGASIYSKIILDPNSSILKYIETTVHSLGIEILGRRYKEIIPKNTPIPSEGLVVTYDEELQTSSDNIDKMVIVVYEYTKSSERNVLTVNEKGMIRLCGTTLKGIPKKVKGEEKVSITFTVSRDNILAVTAKSCSSNGINTQLKVDELY